MSNSLFVPAVREQLKIRAAIAGPSGSGKTLGALRMAYGITGDWSKIFAIGTVNESTLAYVDDKDWGIGQFMFYNMGAPYTPERFVEAAKAAAEAGGSDSVLIIDTLSKMWDGSGGVLEILDRMTGNSFTNWGKINPRFYGALGYLLGDIPCHVIATLRNKMKSVVEEGEDDKGRKKTTVRKIGVEAIFRPGNEYEFPLYLQVDRDHVAEVVTMRGSMLPNGDQPFIIDESTGRYLVEWANQGVEQVAREDPLPKSIPQAQTSGNGRKSVNVGTADPAEPYEDGDLIIGGPSDWTSYYQKVVPYFGLTREEGQEVLGECNNDVVRATELLKARNEAINEKAPEQGKLLPPEPAPSAAYTREDYEKAIDQGDQYIPAVADSEDVPDPLDDPTPDPVTGELPIPDDELLTLEGELNE